MSFLRLTDGLAQTCLNPLRHLNEFGFRRPLLLFLRRHFASFQEVQDQLPAVQVATFAQAIAKVMEGYLAFALFRSVAFHASCLEKRHHNRIESRLPLFIAQC